MSTYHWCLAVAHATAVEVKLELAVQRTRRPLQYQGHVVPRFCVLERVVQPGSLLRLPGACVQLAAVQVDIESGSGTAFLKEYLSRLWPLAGSRQRRQVGTGPK